MSVLTRASAPTKDQLNFIIMVFLARALGSQFNERQEITRYVMGKAVLIFALHMKAYRRMLDKHVRLEGDRLAQVTRLKCSDAKPSSNSLWSNLARKVFPYSIAFYPGCSMNCSSNSSQCLLEMKEAIGFSWVKLPSVKGAPPSLNLLRKSVSCFLVSSPSSTRSIN